MSLDQSREGIDMLEMLIIMKIQEKSKQMKSSKFKTN